MKKSLRWVISYALVAGLGLWMAFAVSRTLMRPAHSQEAPSSGELPPEFANEVEAGSSLPPTTPAPNQNPGASSPPTAAPSNQINQNAPQAPVLSQGLITGDGYFYDPIGKRDPFKPVGLKALGLARPVVLEPLQRFELEKLQVVGILWDVRSPRAMVKDPDGKMHTVIKNSKIGRSEGFVATIREGELVVVETLYEDGKTLKQTRVMELKK